MDTGGVGGRANGRVAGRAKQWMDGRSSRSGGWVDRWAARPSRAARALRPWLRGTPQGRGGLGGGWMEGGWMGGWMDGWMKGRAGGCWMDRLMARPRHAARALRPRAGGAPQRRWLAGAPKACAKKRGRREQRERKTPTRDKVEQQGVHKGKEECPTSTSQDPTIQINANKCKARQQDTEKTGSKKRAERQSHGRAPHNHKAREGHRKRKNKKTQHRRRSQGRRQIKKHRIVEAGVRAKVTAERHTTTR